ncbi:Asp-tRNA(Asn)/Glu-tRNA(Gln) amidotransferase subunit GatC [Roseivirga sp.]|uniref:Asp-tRNA(Asn)/Glu-tRNA(Gln) amidotransferase subunit GatC n=1 Tax=Roseivirga sp. TaxID=1964215 RepID=UPI002B2770F9|nr:Asp-tRNA(Asn)/Glu-tRNA(Gln) amidotransferase subunit GatC [Roseivirga sp.]
MQVDKKTLYQVAHLARLNIKPEEEAQLLNDMSEILTWVGKLDELNTEGVEPLTHMTEEVNVFRKDKAEISITQEQALNNAAMKDTQFFKVPKVLK